MYLNTQKSLFSIYFVLHALTLKDHHTLVRFAIYIYFLFSGYVLVGLVEYFFSMLLVGLLDFLISKCLVLK